VIACLTRMMSAGRYSSVRPRCLAIIAPLPHGGIVQRIKAKQRLDGKSHTTLVDEPEGGGWLPARPISEVHGQFKVIQDSP
jgi:hypothetical protein